MLKFPACLFELLDDESLEFLKLFIGISSFFLFQWYNV